MRGTRKRGRGDGTIDQSGETTWRIRYRIGGQRFQATVRGTKSDARRELRALLRSGDTGEHVTPDKMTLAQWIEHWISIGCPGNKNRKRVGQKTSEGYAHSCCAEAWRASIATITGHRN
jgi:integrase